VPSESINPYLSPTKPTQTAPKDPVTPTGSHLNRLLQDGTLATPPATPVAAVKKASLTFGSPLAGFLQTNSKALRSVIENLADLMDKVALVNAWTSFMAEPFKGVSPLNPVEHISPAKKRGGGFKLPTPVNRGLAIARLFLFRTLDEAREASEFRVLYLRLIFGSADTYLLDGSH